MRTVLGVIAGMVAAIVVIMLVQMVSSAMYPMPEGLTMEDKEGFANYIRSLPALAFIIVIIGYLLGSLAGGFVSTKVAKTKFLPAWIIGGLLTLGGIWNGMIVPQPSWVTIVSLLMFIPGAYFGAKMVNLGES